jgi:CpeT protein
VIDVVQDGEEYHLKNYEIANPLQFAECKGIETITEDMLTYREGCDIIMRQTGTESYFGGTSTCHCNVNWNGIDTFVQNEVRLTKDEYHVTDKGLHVENHTKVWGSDYGAFKFVRQ